MGSCDDDIDIDNTYEQTAAGVILAARASIAIRAPPDA